jgi:hypothetical protein
LFLLIKSLAKSEKEFGFGYSFRLKSIGFILAGILRLSVRSTYKITADFSHYQRKK